ncbi:hypothetical protein Pve01_62470 [Planomonospora venezuelensis]|nr:hypothetical protein Pve01_62470 [Planomonospora venezuelensis]
MLSRSAAPRSVGGVCEHVVRELRPGGPCRRVSLRGRAVRVRSERFLREGGRDVFRGLLSAMNIALSNPREPGSVPSGEEGAARVAAAWAEEHPGSEGVRL